eukprot:6213797-Pleurochrysis_carterae.AAC.8
MHIYCTRHVAYTPLARARDGDANERAGEPDVLPTHHPSQQFSRTARRRTDGRAARADSGGSGDGVGRKPRAVV